MRERPIVFKKEKKRGPQGCFRPGVPRPWQWKGGRKAAQDRYRENHKDILKDRHKAEYERNKEKYKATRKIYVEKNKKSIYVHNKKWQQEYWKKIRNEMINVYGGKCSCCGETEPIFLELDHIYNDGKIRRKKAGNARQEILELKNLGWPKDNHQLLCCNCNQGKYRNNGTCPHKTKNL